MKQDAVVGTKKEAERHRVLDEVLWRACERNGHDKEVCRWFKGLSGKVRTSENRSSLLGRGDYNVAIHLTRYFHSLA